MPRPDTIQILLLEDSASDASFIQTILRRAGIQFESTIASDEDEFNRALDNRKYHVVLADNALPQYSSAEALALIRKTNPHVAFILVTGTVSEEFAVKILQQGADDYILKNNLTRLPSAIQNAVEKKRIAQLKEQAEAELLQINEQLRQLAAHLHQVREEEQQRIARELHDELGQHITGLKMDLFQIRKLLGSEVSPEVKERMTAMQHMLEEAVKTVRKIASELRPSILYDLGLLAALDWQAAEFEKRFAIPVQVIHDREGLAMGPDNAIGIFRVFQESLTNIARHSGATQVLCETRTDSGNFQLSIRDNGKGFDIREARKKRSLGLLGMNERVLMMKGSMQIVSAPGKGTTIQIEVPLL